MTGRHNTSAVNHSHTEGCIALCKMPRPKKEPGGEPKTRSRNGCWPCKARKVKCGEERPICANCTKNSETCDYSIRLNWRGRSRKDGTPGNTDSFTFVSIPPSGTPGLKKADSNGHEHLFSSQHIVGPSQRPWSGHSSNLPTPEPTPDNEGGRLDPRLRLVQHPNQEAQRSPRPTSSKNLHARDHDGLTPTYLARSPPTSYPDGSHFQASPENGAKRIKLSPTLSSSKYYSRPSFAIPLHPSSNEVPHASAHSPYSISSIVNGPVTPGSSINSSSPYPAYQSLPAAVQDAPDLRRLSVKSLLSDPSDASERVYYHRPGGHGYRTYGYDHGFTDLDIPRNDDNNVVLPRSPDMRRASTAVSEASTSSGELDAKQIAFEPGGYYAQPVPVKIPRFLEPLPVELASNQMNLLYFHHFINHTGRILVPHDCAENPFRTILPQMAMHNQQLLHLLLAYSAHHRARLLGHAEPAARIAGWMDDVLPALRQALAEPSSPGNTKPSDPSSLAPLATAIMLASLEIVSPSTFAASISWQQHLRVARQMIIAKGGLDHLAQKADGARDKAIFFLSRWFAYLDVLGSLSGSLHEQPLFGAYLENGGGLWLVNRGDEEVYQIDCFFGFSGRCISLLAQVAGLASQCENQRIDLTSHAVNTSWRPSDLIRHEASTLQLRLLDSASATFRGCTHAHNPDSPATDQDVAEIYATNSAYHHAGLIHLAKRVLNHPPHSADVQENVTKILSCLRSVRPGSSAESCLLFPMFTAGCEALTEGDREIFRERLKGIERYGQDNVRKARVLMDRVWSMRDLEEASGGNGGRVCWEGLVEGEFFG